MANVASGSFRRLLVVGCAAVVVLAAFAVDCEAAANKKSQEAAAKKALDAADQVMGDWQGEWAVDDGSDSGACVAQVVALGKGKYRINLLDRFDASKPVEPISVLEGQKDGDAVKFSGKGTYDNRDLQLNVTITDGKLTGTFDAGDGRGDFSMEKVYRLSATLGKKPPKGAVVLFRKKADAAKWQHPGKDDLIGWALTRTTMAVKPGGGGSIISKKKFKDIELHMEFRSPFMPEARGQGRGNSGVYLQGRYEVQILDSYGLDGRDNECGGVYQVGEPLVNMCAVPTQWQTYDITFIAPKFDAQGKKTEDARLTVKHNNVLIQDGIKVPGATTAALGGDPREAAGIYLQDHGNKVEYRNIWVAELKGT